MRNARAAVVEGPGSPFTVQEVELDGPREHEVLVRMVATGLCHTDLGVRAGGIPFPLPGVLGHEGAGVVEEVGAGVDGLVPGTPVVASFTSCGRCDNCVAGRPARCRTWVPDNLLTGVRDDGSSAIRRAGVPVGSHFFGQSALCSHAVMDERSVVLVPVDVDLRYVAPLGCSGVTGFGSVRNVLRVTAGSSLAVLGTGAVGLFAVVAARLAGADPLIAVDIVPERLDLARELGATHTVNPDQENLGARLAAITGPRGLANAFDTTAVPGVMRAALDTLGTGGTLAFCGAPPPGTELCVDVQAMLVGKRIVGITMGDADPHRLVPQLTELYARGELPLERLVRHYPLADVEQAASDMHHGVTVKPVVVFG
jgi:aryl-alcohol dehydrogenase